MSASLQPLIRLNKWKVDEKSRDLARLLGEAEALRLKDQALLAEFEHEKATAERSPEAAMTFGTYTAEMVSHRQVLAQQMAIQEKRVEAARDLLRQAMGEAKKFEVAQAARTAEERAEERAHESDALDEAALNGFRRKDEG